MLACEVLPSSMETVIASGNVHGDTLKNGDDDLPSSRDAPDYPFPAVGGRKHQDILNK